MKNCFLFQDDLKAYADGELSPLRRLLVRRHLTHCASCQKEILEMTQVTEELRASEPEDAFSPTLREKLLAEPAADGSEVGAGFTLALKPLVRRRRPIPAWAFAAVAIVAWFICYPLFQRVHEDTRQGASPTAPRVAGTYRSALSDKERQITQQRITGPRSASVLPPPSLPMAPAQISNSTASQSSIRPYAVNGLGPIPTPPNSIDGVANDLNGDPDSLRQVHKEAGIGIQVPNPEATGDKLNTMVSETGGYVAANNLSTGTDGLKSGEMIVKVPEAQFETFLAQVANLGTVISKNITGQDITDKTSDANQAQVVQESDLEKSEARLKALGSHAKWEDQENTRDLRIQLAQTRARLKLLKHMAALGTITIDLSQTPKAVAPITGGFLGTLQGTTHDAVQSLVGSAAALLALVIWLLAYSPIWVPLLLLGRYGLKEYKKREAV